MMALMPAPQLSFDWGNPPLEVPSSHHEGGEANLSGPKPQD